MPRRITPPAEPLEQRWFLSTATESEHAAPHPAPAVHAPATPDTSASETETADGESAAPVAAPTPAPTPSAETEDQADTTPSAAPAAAPTPSPIIEAAPAQAPAPSPAPPIPPGAPIVKAIPTSSTPPALAATAPQPEAEVIPAIFNTRHAITPQDVEAQSILTPITYTSVVTQAVAEVARSPLVLKPATEAILSLTRTDLLATFADSIASFAHESAATPAAASLASIETHHYKWHVTLGVLGIDAFLIGHWYATRRRNTRADAPFSTKSL